MVTTHKHKFKDRYSMTSSPSTADYWPSTKQVPLCLWLHNGTKYGRTVKFSLKGFFFPLRKRCGMGRTEGLFLEELSQDFGMITAPWILTPHVIKRYRHCLSQTPSSSTPSTSLTQKLGHGRRPGFNQVPHGSGLTSIKQLYREALARNTKKEKYR